MTHLHITSWALALILLIVTTMLYKQGKTKPAKILHMILRLDYLLILYTGGNLLTLYLDGSTMFSEAVLKALIGLWVIVSIEMIAVKTSKGKPAKSFWIQFIIGFIIALVLGFGRLPYGLLP